MPNSVEPTRSPDRIKPMKAGTASEANPAGTEATDMSSKLSSSSKVPSTVSAAVSAPVAATVSAPVPAATGRPIGRNESETEQSCGREDDHDFVHRCAPPELIRYATLPFI
jgi:hypothetical protein